LKITGTTFLLFVGTYRPSRLEKRAAPITDTKNVLRDIWNILGVAADDDGLEVTLQMGISCDSRN